MWKSVRSWEVGEGPEVCEGWDFGEELRIVEARKIKWGVGVLMRDGKWGN